MTDWLTSDVVTAVRRHMNEDHTEDSLLIVRSLGGVPQATSATMSGMDESAAFFGARVDGREVEVAVPWSGPLVDRAQIRAEVVRMYEQACTELGIIARAH